MPLLTVVSWRLDENIVWDELRVQPLAIDIGELLLMEEDTCKLKTKIYGKGRLSTGAVIKKVALVF